MCIYHSKCNDYSKAPCNGINNMIGEPPTCFDKRPLKAKTEPGANVPLDRLVMPYAVEQRLRLIDFLLSQYGHVNRSAIMDYFGIGAATATRDFKAYKGLCKDNVIYDDVDKSYHRSNRFKRVWP